VSLSLPSDSGELAIEPSADHRVTILDFWAPTCEPCRKKLPELVARESEAVGKGARLVLVAVLADDESTEFARTTLTAWGVHRPFLVDRSDSSRRQLRVTALPATLITDGSGKLTWVAPPDASVSAILSAVDAAR